MRTGIQDKRFGRYAFFVLGYNILVILWGVFLRASKSGDGCGQHWLTCRGELIPTAPELKTLIEFSHRITSAIAFFTVVALAIWAFKRFQKGALVRKTAIGALVFIVTEALVGAGLVLTGNTAETLTPVRPLWMAGHLTNTFVLLAFLTLTWRFADGSARLSSNLKRSELAVLILGALGIFAIGVTGSVAALSNMIFPSESLIGGLAQDLSASSHPLIRSRILHPISSILIGVAITFAAAWLAKRSGSETSANWSRKLTYLVLAQLVLGATTLLTGAPILMQLMHLLLADLIWISFVLLGASLFTVYSAKADSIDGSSTDSPAAS